MTTYLLQLFLLAAFLVAGCGHISDEIKLARSIMINVAKTLEQRYQIKIIGFSEAGDKDYYNKIGLEFNVYRVLSKDEGREILIGCTEELLKSINSNSELQRYLQPYPFIVENVDIALYVYQLDGSDTYYPDISVITNWGGKIEFKTESKELKHKFGYTTREKESYEEALKIVRTQN
ncbi:MAG: hypothetical protein H0U49_07145 [Parachlamydiaceae bacterium]|nr:hypothetical protein [Parachlamydiaceae bacterium]